MLRKLIAQLNESPFLAIMVDETSDVANIEQVAICVRYIDKKLEAHEVFLGVYSTQDTKATSLEAIVIDVLQRTGIPIHKLRLDTQHVLKIILSFHALHAGASATTELHR